MICRRQAAACRSLQSTVFSPRPETGQRAALAVDCGLSTENSANFALKKKESADKPGSVVGNHSSGARVAARL